MSTTLAQLAKMTPEQREARLHGIDETTRLKLVALCLEILQSLVHEGLRKLG